MYSHTNHSAPKIADEMKRIQAIFHYTFHKLRPINFLILSQPKNIVSKFTAKQIASISYAGPRGDAEEWKWFRAHRNRSVKSLPRNVSTVTCDSWSGKNVPNIRLSHPKWHPVLTQHKMLWATTFKSYWYIEWLIPSNHSKCKEKWGTFVTVWRWHSLFPWKLFELICSHFNGLWTFFLSRFIFPLHVQISRCQYKSR